MSKGWVTTQLILPECPLNKFRIYLNKDRIPRTRRIEDTCRKRKSLLELKKSSLSFYIIKIIGNSVWQILITALFSDIDIYWRIINFLIYIFWCFFHDAFFLWSIQISHDVKLNKYMVILSCIEDTNIFTFK